MEPRESESRTPDTSNTKSSQKRIPSPQKHPRKHGQHKPHSLHGDAGVYARAARPSNPPHQSTGAEMELGAREEIGRAVYVTSSGSSPRREGKFAAAVAAGGEEGRRAQGESPPVTVRGANRRMKSATSAVLEPEDVVGMFLPDPGHIPGPKKVGFVKGWCWLASPTSGPLARIVHCGSNQSEGFFSKKKVRVCLGIFELR